MGSTWPRGIHGFPGETCHCWSKSCLSCDTIPGQLVPQSEAAEGHQEAGASRRTGLQQ